jgi:hypothetical protein
MRVALCRLCAADPARPACASARARHIPAHAQAMLPQPCNAHHCHGAGPAGPSGSRSPIHHASTRAGYSGGRRSRMLTHSVSWSVGDCSVTRWPPRDTHTSSALAHLARIEANTSHVVLRGLVRTASGSAADVGHSGAESWQQWQGAFFLCQHTCTRALHACTPGLHATKSSVLR